MDLSLVLESDIVITLRECTAFIHQVKWLGCVSSPLWYHKELLAACLFTEEEVRHLRVFEFRVLLGLNTAKKKN